jgi:plasmid stability protein
MATLTIRNLPDDIRTRLRVRASSNGRSMEAEARAIIAGAINAPSVNNLPNAVAQIQDWVARSAKKKTKVKAGDTVDTFLRDRRRAAIREAIDDGIHPKELFRSEFSRIASEAGWTVAHIDQLVRQYKL